MATYNLDIPTTFPNTELEVFIFLRPATGFESNSSQIFSERWQGKFKGILQAEKSAEERDLRLEYLAERYNL